MVAERAQERVRVVHGRFQASVGALALPNGVAPLAPLLFVVLVVPLIVDPGAYNLYSLPKAAVVLVCAIICMAVGASVRGVRGLPDSVSIALAVLVALLVASTLFSRLPMVSALGKFGRYEGLGLLLSYAAIFLAARTSLNNDNARGLAQLFTAFALVCVAAYALAQRLGFDLAFSNSSGPVLRPWSFLGNASTMGAYVAMASLVVFPCLLEGTRRRRLLAVVVLLPGLLSLWLSGSRGAWLGFLAGAVVLVLLAGDRPQRKKLFLYLLAAGGLTFVLLAPSIVNRLSTENEWASKTVRGRIELWQRVSNLVTDRPLAGWGSETLEYVFPKTVDEEWAEVMPTATVVDNAHNSLLHIAYTSGIPAAALLVWLGVAAIVGTRRQLRMGPPPPAVAGMMGAAIAYAVALMFHPSLPHTSGTWAVYAGSAAAYVWPYPATQETGRTRKKTTMNAIPRSDALPVAVERVVAIVLVLGGMWATGAHARTLWADHLLLSAVEAEASGDLLRATSLGRDAQRTASHEVAYGRYATGIALKFHAITGDSAALSQARDSGLAATATNPLDALSWRLLAEALSREASHVAPLHMEAADAARRAGMLDPRGIMETGLPE